MSYEISFRPEAEKDIEDAALWYERQRPGLGRAFLKEVSDALNTITEQPLMYPIIYRDIHRALTHKFPFGVFYQIDKKSIIVFAILHVSRNPHLWKNRTM